MTLPVLSRSADTQTAMTFSDVDDRNHWWWSRCEKLDSSDGASDAVMMASITGMLVSPLMIFTPTADIIHVGGVAWLAGSIMGPAALLCGRSVRGYHRPYSSTGKIYERSLRRRLQRAARRDQSWFPRVGIKHPLGRNDTYNRYKAVVEVVDNESWGKKDPSKLLFQISVWSMQFDQASKRWKGSKQVVKTCKNEDELSDALPQFVSQCQQWQQKAQEDFQAVKELKKAKQLAEGESLDDLEYAQRRQQMQYLANQMSRLEQ